MTYDREQLEKTLAPLRLPKSGDDRSAFERELDSRFGALAWSADCTPEECVGLALWLGSQGWTAFAIDSDLKPNPPGTRARFSRALRLDALERDTNGKHMGLVAKRLAARALKQKDSMGLGWPAKEISIGRYVRTYRSRRKPSTELLALYGRDEGKLPVEEVKRMRREHMKRELQWSAQRLTSHDRSPSVRDAAQASRSPGR